MGHTHHKREPGFGEDEALVHQAVQQLGRVLDDGHVGDLGKVLVWGVSERGSLLPTG